MSKRSLKVRVVNQYLFYPPGRRHERYSENRMRQIFCRYVDKAGLNHEYGQDALGRNLHRLTVHSLRHAHVMSHIHVHKLPLPIVQRQVGHKSLRSTSIYLNPSDETVAEAYAGVQKKISEVNHWKFHRS